jgi:hypothetical protein
MRTKIDIRLERDPRYVAAVNHYNKLKMELDALERQRDEGYSGLNSLASHARDRLTQEATALLSGAVTTETLNLDTLIKTLEELTHKVAVLREAVSMQKRIVDELRGVVGKAIAIDLLPQHKANVAEVFKALTQLNAAAQIHHDLCDSLHQNNVPASGYIRPMSIPGLGLLSDKFSRASMFVLEAYEYDFIALSDVPDNLKEWARAKKAKPVQVAQASAVANADGWLNATP